MIIWRRAGGKVEIRFRRKGDEKRFGNSQWYNHTELQISSELRSSFELEPKFHIPSFSYVTAGPNEWRCIIRKKAIFYFFFEAQVEPNHPQISNKKFAERHSAGKVIFASWTFLSGLPQAQSSNPRESNFQVNHLKGNDSSHTTSYALIGMPQNVLASQLQTGCIHSLDTKFPFIQTALGGTTVFLQFTSGRLTCPISSRERREDSVRFCQQLIAFTCYQVFLTWESD